MSSSRNTSKRRRLAVPLAIAALATSGAAALTSGAFFTASTSVSGNSFTTGTVNIAATPATAAVSLTGMAPGDSKVGEITVNNTGSLQMKYNATSVADNTDGKGLASALVTTVKTGVTTCTAAGFGATGTQVYSGVLGSAGGSSWFTGRVLAASASEKLCVQVALPSSAGNGLQNATTSATVTFDAAQTANNP